MKMNEIANAQDQLELLRTIIDNTWSAIKQQADAQAKQTAINKHTNRKVAKPIGIKKAPYAISPNPLPKPKPKPAPSLQQLPNTPPKLTPAIGAPKEVTRNIASPTNQNRTEKEKQELIKIARGETPWKPL